MTLESWISTHPYLRPVAAFHVQLSEAMRSVPLTCAHVPDWQGYAEDYRAGIPVLKSSHATVDTAEAGRIVLSLLEKLSSIELPKTMRRESLELKSEFHREPGKSRQLISWLLGIDTCTVPHAGLSRHIGWSALAQYLRPLVAAFENWRDEESWMQPYCPFCGSGPSMAQLTGADPGRRRLLACGCCRARWQFRRIECPFCENTNDHQMSVLTVERERQLRIDHCHACGGYLKTYDGEGWENVMLADWTSLHLDLLARERGLRRFANSLYEL